MTKSLLKRGGYKKNQMAVVVAKSPGKSKFDSVVSPDWLEVNGFNPNGTQKIVPKKEKWDDIISESHSADLKKAFDPAMICRSYNNKDRPGFQPKVEEFVDWITQLLQDLHDGKQEWTAFAKKTDVEGKLEVEAIDVEKLLQIPLQDLLKGIIAEASWNGIDDDDTTRVIQSIWEMEIVDAGYRSAVTDEEIQETALASMSDDDLIKEIQKRGIKL